jgi:hypothetical protein
MPWEGLSMENEPSFWTRLYEFGWSFWPYWWALAAGGIFALEPMMESYLRPDQKVWLDYRWPKDARQRHFRWASIVAILVASFLAFDDVSTRSRSLHKADQGAVEILRGERDEARRQIATTTPGGQQKLIEQLQADLSGAREQLQALKQASESRHLTAAQTAAIRASSGAKGSEPFSIKVAIPNNCRDCNEYATEFIELLSSLGWKIVGFNEMFGGINPRFRGIQLVTKVADHPSQSAIALANSLTAAGIVFTGTAGVFDVQDNDVALIIGPKPDQ